MTAPVKPVDAWAVVAPDGEVFAETIRHLRSEAQSMFFGNWRIWYRRGYRCVRVTVAVKEGE